MTSLIQDLRFAVRALRRDPLTSVVVVLTLALGIGANTAMFAAFDAWVLRPLDLEQPERLVALHESRSKLGGVSGVAPANFRDWQQQSRSFEAIAPFSRHVFNFHDDDDPDRVQGARVAASLFPLLGKDPASGRHFLPADDSPGGPAVALVSHHLWQTRFDADPNVLGRTFRLDGQVHQVVGVMPPGFEFPEWAHVWTPLALPAEGGERAARRLSVVARLAPGVSLQEARSELRTIAARAERLHPETNAGWSAEVRPLRDEWSPPIVRLALIAAIVAAGAVLLVICANVASLLLAQASRRRREVALKTALGASRGRLVRQTLGEGVALGLGGGALGLVVGSWWVEAMLAWAPIDPPYLFRFAVDGRALAYTLAAAVAAGLVCALAPVVRSSGLDASESLKSGGRTVVGAGGQRLRRLLVVGEVALSVLLLTGALLMVKSFLREQRIEPGYHTDGVLTARLSFTGTDFEESASRVAVVSRVLDRVAGLAGVEAVGAADRLPVSRSGFVARRLEAEGRPVERGGEPAAAYHSVTRDYLATLGLPVVEGRGFTASESAEGADTVLVSRSVARQLWPEGSALGRRLRFAGEGEEGWRRVVGVVGDVDPGHSMTASSWPKMQVYVPYGGDPAAVATLAVRTAGNPLGLAAAIRSELRLTAPGVPVSGLLTLEQAVDEVHWVSGQFSRLFTYYALIALAIAALGAYGIVADSVSQRTREMGIRLALGARPGDLVTLVVAQGAGLAVAGVLLGLAAAVPATRFLATMLYQVSAADPVVYGSVAVLLVAVVLIAAYLPARRAARVDPVEVLRFE